MQTNNSKSATLLKSVLAASVLLLGGETAMAQQQVNLTAAASNAAMPDGTAVPMWGYSCGAVVTGSTATCAALNPQAGQAWSPVIITVPSGQDLRIDLTNNLPVPPQSTTGGVPTSLVIVGQVGGGLGSGGTKLASPTHAAQGATWPIAGAPDTSMQSGGDPSTAGNPTFTPPPQPARVQSFSTEVATSATATLIWKAPRPGTYLIESGTHPSIQVPMGLIGMVVVTCASGDTSGCTSGTAYANVAYDADLPILLSEVDPVQNAAVNTAVGKTKFAETNAFAGYTATGATSWHCKDTTGTATDDNACYPPAVDYTPTYYLINGRGFSRTNASASLVSINPSTVTAGNLLVRLVNAGLRMHVPSIVGATSLGTTATPGMALIAEDGNPLPGKARVQSEVFMAAGKTYDVMINVPPACTPVPPATTCTNPALPIFDRQLSLSANTTARDSGMLAYIGANNAVAPMVGSQATASAKDDAYTLLIGQTLTVSDPSRGVIANDTNVTGVALLALPTAGTVTLNTNGTFTYVPNNLTATPPPTAITPDSFTYCANGSVTGAVCSSNLTATVTLGASAVAGSGVNCGAGTGSPANATFTASVAGQITVKPPGILAGCTDGAGLALSIKGATASAALTVGGATISADGGFSAASTSGTQSFLVTVQNGQGDTDNVTVTVNYPTGSGLKVTVVDGTDHTTPITDYRWVIEEDRTFYVDPKCTTNPLPAGCPIAITSGPAAGAPVNYGTNFHTSYMPLVAAGCTGKNSCEGGQTLQGANVVCDVGNGVCRPGDGTGQTPTDPGLVPLDPTKRYYISVLPGDAADPFLDGNATNNCLNGQGNANQTNPDGSSNRCGHGMGGAPIPAGATSVQVLAIPTPLPTATMSVFVFEDDWPLNGEQGAGGGVDVLAVNEPGLGGFQVTIFDQAGGTGDATGQPTYDMFNQPLSNSLAGTLDPITGLDACPISNAVTNNVRAQITARVRRGLATFTYTLAPGSTTLPPAVAVGATLSDGAPAGAIPAGTTISSIAKGATANSYVVTMSANATANVNTDRILVFNPTQQGIVGMIVTCPKFESDGKTLSPMAGQAIIKNLYPGRYGVTALPGADRIALGEEWIQTNTLDGQKSHDSFMRVGEPGYFQEFGPAGYHVSIGFANPKIINDRRTNTANTGICDKGKTGGNLDCSWEIKGSVFGARMSRTPDQRLYSSGSRDSLAFTQCYVSLGDPDGAEIALQKCDANGGFDFKGIPAGNWKLTTFDQWNDQIIDGITQGVGVGCLPTAPGVTSSGPCATGSATAGTTGCASASGTVCDMGEIGVHQWQADIYTRSFIDTDGSGVSADSKPGLALVSTNIRFRDGSYSNFNSTDLNGFAGFNEVFPLFNWYVIETDSTRYKTTGVHVIYDAGGPADGSASCTSDAPCGTSSTAASFANTYEKFPLPAELMPPGSVACANADCSGGESIAIGPTQPPAVYNSTGRIDPPYWFGSYGWQGYIGQGNFLEFGKKPFAAGETGPIHGHVIYASTRPFDDPQLLLQLSWEPMIPHVQVNLYQEGVAADGVTPTLTLVDHTETTSFDDWAQGFRKDANGTPVLAADGKSYLPNISCPGQTKNDPNTLFDPFYYALQDQPSYLDLYSKQHAVPGAFNGTATGTPLPYDSQYKCYDGMHSWNQLQPAPYDGMYSFPSVKTLDPSSGKPLGTNCTICVSNPTTATPATGLTAATDPNYDPYRAGTPMLPPGKYVVEVVVPPGYELVKEEDKNILIGDNYIAPATVQFPGLGGSIFILPDQAELSANYNSVNAQNATNGLGRIPSLVSHEGDTGSDESFWPCVGTVRQVPDFISLYPLSGEVSPFAGAMRPLCDRKEVNLTEQSSALVKFYLFTSTHVAAHFQGIILDDFTAEFDPFSPQFGEKFAPSYLPISVKDWTGNEVNRVYSDQFGLYNGLNYSTWEVNPPNPTGYGPTMMTYCMNDANMTNDSMSGQSTPDSLFQPGYSQFCYELPSMPGQTGYFDTPVVPVQAFSEGYNHPDCAYPDATPAIGSVTGDVAGPWVSAAGAGHTITVNSLGNQSVEWYGYTGPAITKAPYNQPKSARNYGFGSAKGTVKVGNVTVPAADVTWGDATISFTAPSGVSACAVQQQSKYSGSQASCGELVITTAAGKQSIDTVTITIGGKKPTVLTAGQTIQSAIDAASPGDMIIVPPGSYNEMVVMWKPIRLQGVGAASSVIDANTQPAGKLLTPWRQKIVCLFGLTVDGRPRSTSDQACNAGMSFSLIGDTTQNFATMTVDRLPFEATLGWDASLNGNLAEQLSEPSLLGAYEGAAITVLGKGVKFPRFTAINDAFGATTGAAFPDNTVLLTASDCGGTGATNPYPTNYFCNPSSIDGLGIRDSSQGGGGIFVHGYAHNLQIANNRVHNNTGTLSGGITIGAGEHPDVQLAGAATVLSYPQSCENSNVTNLALPFCFNLHVNVHNNAVVGNSSMGDELFSSTPAGAGGVSINTGADYYKFTNNWMCGNISTGDGGGFSHIGFSKNGDIENNTIIFNQSTNPTITTNGGGILVMGAPDADPTTCGVTTDQDCLPPPGTISPSDGTGQGLVINANLILGNAADSGSGGGLRLQAINGTDVLNFLNGSSACAADLGVGAGHHCYWNSANVTNNIIVNNVAGWDGAGVSLLDSLAVNIVNNTIAANDSTASSGTLFQTLFAPLASSTPVPVTKTICGATGGQSCPQVSGLVSVTNSPVLVANINQTSGTKSCPQGHGANSSACFGTNSAPGHSIPLMFNDAIWQNRSFYIGVGGFGTAASGQNQQHLVTLYNAAHDANNQATTTGTGTTAASQAMTGDCPAGGSYWEIGFRGDAQASSHTAQGFTPTNSVLSGSVYGTGIQTGSPAFKSQYCNGSRTPPEAGGTGWQVPPGTNETNAFPNPVFNLTPAAVVDEGNNWVNLRWGPLSLYPIDPAIASASHQGASPLADYTPQTGSSAIDKGAASLTFGSGGSAVTVNAPKMDFYGNTRPAGAGYDIGAIEAAGVAVVTDLSVTKVDNHGGSSVTVTSGKLGNGATIIYTMVVTNNGPSAVTGATLTDTLPALNGFALLTVSTTNGWTCSTTGTGASCTPGGSGNSTRTGTMNLPVGGTATFTLRASVSPFGQIAILASSATSMANVVSVAAPAGVTDSNTGNNTATDTTNIVKMSSITPTSANRPATGSPPVNVQVTIAGANLGSATSVTMTGTGVTCGSVSATATAVTASCAITSAAATGNRPVTVATPDGNAFGLVNFRVN
jgi:uncharacterized repeat protein (TIGR01451 family)